MTNKPMLSVECIFCGCRNEIPAASWGCVTRVEGQCFVCKRPIVWVADDKPAAQHQPNTGVLYPRCTILKECNVKSSPASDARINAVAKPITRRICHGCVGLPRDVFCPICDGEQPAPVAALITDEQILEAMRPAMMSADGGYVFDTAKQDVIEAGRALLSEVARLDGVKP